RNTAEGPFSPAGLDLVPLVHIPAARVLPTAFLSWSNSGQAFLNHQNFRRIVQRQMWQSVGEHFEKLQLELLGSGRGDDRVQLVENRVFSRVIPTGNVFGSKLVLSVWNIFGVKPLLPFFNGNVVGSDVSAGP